MHTFSKVTSYEFTQEKNDFTFKVNKTYCMHILTIAQPRPDPLFRLTLVAQICAQDEVEDRGKMNYMLAFVS